MAQFSVEKAVGLAANVDDDEKICRYCFEGEEEGELLSPCNCDGGQKWVHLACLRRWQRMVLISQPTHPAFYERDPRHYKCNVCNGAFTCEPPTRLELMSSFTGPELGALISPGCVIAAHEVFSTELQRQIEDMPEPMQELSSYRFWIGGVYLITAVEPESATFTLPVRSASSLEAVRQNLGADLRTCLGDGAQQVRLVAGGAFASARNDAELRTMLEEATFEEGMEIILAKDPPPGVGDDHVAALGLAYQVPRAVDELAVIRAREAAARRYRGTSSVKLLHYKGGPCGADSVAGCVVAGGTGVGWTVVKELSKAILLAYSRSVPRSEAQGPLRIGSAVRLAGLVARPELNGEVGRRALFLFSLPLGSFPTRGREDGGRLFQ
jgi:hypothetical protein